MIAAENIIGMKKFTIKFPSQKVDSVPVSRSCEFRNQLSLVNERGHSSSVRENNHSLMDKSQNTKLKSTMQGAKKRSQSGVIESSYEKRRKMDCCIIDSTWEKKQKMDRSMTQQCSALLKALMFHRAGWVFNQPVDPVALNIPDYFSIISDPMDLGTIKSKLQKNLYVGINEFAADVRLTFSNAMLYNPPTNNVHKMAKELKDFFETRWKILEEKLKCQILKFGSEKILSGRTNEVTDKKHTCPKTFTPCCSVLPKRSKPSEEKVQRSSFDAKTVEVKVNKPAENCASKAVEQKFHKGANDGRRPPSGSINVRPPLSQVASKCLLCDWNACQCCIPSDSMLAASDLSSERSSGRGHHMGKTDALKLVKTISASQISKSDPDSDGAVSAVDDDNTCLSSGLTTFVTDAASGEGWRPLFDVQLSPTKALRAAMVKQRFADTILKAQHKTLLVHGDKADPVRMQQEKERLERRRQEEKAKIEAEIRAAEAASRKREEIELKKQRDRERKDARIALEKMEKTAGIEQNLEILKELEKLCGCSFSFNFHFYAKGAGVVKGEIGDQLGSPLERLGLFMKDDFEGEDEEMILDGEEGEILF